MTAGTDSSTVNDTKIIHARYPDVLSGKNATPLKEMMDRGEPEQIIRKRIVYEYRPLYILAFVICFALLVWAVAFVIVQLSDNQTARACFAAGGDWGIGSEGVSECSLS
jgi:hypothetical protein